MNDRLLPYSSSWHTTSSPGPKMYFWGLCDPHDLSKIFTMSSRVVGLQTLQQHLLVRGHTRASEHGRVLGHPDQEHEALSHRRAGSGLVEGVHLENSVQHLAVVQLVHQALQTLVAIAEHLQRLVLRQLEQDPVHVRLLLLELFPHVLERHVALLHVVLVAREVDILRRDVENVFVGGVAARSAIQLTNDDVLGHLLESVHLETNMGSLAIRVCNRSTYAEELTDLGVDGTHTRTLNDGSLATDPSDEHELGASARNGRLVLKSNHLNKSKLALQITIQNTNHTLAGSKCLIHSS